ncbi:MAG TPA: zinc ribbon domain-containing protein [Gemmatimonadaceae bacterium]|nr:zinc ribbon domain-containing protein [Gemmatimonadaceae bacterium]
MIALALGTVLAIAAMAFVLWPLFRDVEAAPTDGYPAQSALASKRERAVDALREIEFDRATGKLSDADYASLKTRYTAEAVAAMRAESGGETLPPDSDVEALIEKARTRAARCPEHGTRPEPDATYCSECGRFLGGACRQCGAAVTAPGARFCDSCGHRLAA